VLVMRKGTGSIGHMALAKLLKSDDSDLNASISDNDQLLRCE
jgi:hypothetical protein